MKKTDLIIILVIYKKRFKDIPSLNFIKNVQAQTDLKLHLVIYDNSPEDINNAAELPGDISYVHNKSNPGLATAYNYGLEICTDQNCEWLLLLDHDTELTAEYFEQVFELFEKNLLTDDIAAVMPIVKVNETIIAPVKRHLRQYHVALNKTGKLTGDISGINSCTVVRVSFVKKLGGFNLNFPLDFLDHWFFYQVSKASQYVFVLDTVIQQNLSISDFKQNIDTTRYNSILKAQIRFYKEKSLLYSARFKLTLLKQLFSHLVYNNNKQFALVAFKNLVRCFT